MKLKKYLSSLLVIALFASCSNEGILDNNNTSIDNVPEGAVEFNLSFPGRTFQPRTYGDNVQPITNGTFAALDYEKALSHVDVFVFENNSQDKPGKLISIDRVRLTDNNVANVEADNTPATTTGATGKFFVRNISGKVHLVATANLLFDDAKKESLVGKSFSDIANTLVTQSPATPNYFPMVSEPKKVEVPRTGATSPNPISFLLERLSVRIDILNNSGFFAGGSSFWIRQVKTNVGSLNQSYLMNTSETPLANGDGKGTKYKEQSFWRSVNYDNKQVFGQIYTYENGSNEFVLGILGNIGNNSTTIDVPFNKPLVRNTRYLVTLTATPDNKIGATVEVVDWNKGGEVIVEASDLKKAPEVKKFEKTAGTTANWKPAENKLEVDKNGATMRLVVKSNVVPMLEVKDTFIPWIKFEETALNSGEQEADAEVKAYNLTFSKNFDSYQREAKLVLHTEGTQDKANRTVIKVTQGEQKYADIVNPLAILSKYYVGKVGNFIEKNENFLDEQHLNDFGMGYQWGRNNSLDRMAINYETRYTQLPANSPLLPKNENIRYFVENKFWTSEPITTATRWQDLVNKSGAGTDYTGTNTIVPGDPSPEGFKIPDDQEIGTIFPLPFVKTSSAYGDNVSETLLFLNHIPGNELPVNYTADYKSKDGILYSIKMKEGKDGKYLTAFRYEVRQNTVKITSRWLGKTEGAKDENKIAKVTEEDWWKTNNGSDVVRVYNSQLNLFGFVLNRVKEESGKMKIYLAVLNKNLTGVGVGSPQYVQYILPIRAK